MRNFTCVQDLGDLKQALLNNQTICEISLVYKTWAT